jgi:transposase
VGASQRRTLEGPASIIPFVCHLLATLRRVVERWLVGPSLVPTHRAVGSAEQGELAGRIRRRHVCLGKKGGDLVGPTKRGKGTKLMLLVDGAGLPLAVDVDSASPAEVGLIEPLLNQAVTEYIPRRLIYDRAADSDALRERLDARDIELICPHRRRRVRPAAQDGRPLRRYRKRWIIERTISWLQSFRRLVTRYEFYAFLFHSFAKLACLMIVLRRF